MYIGRFAPSPSGPLHFGSIVAALASYLDAKANHGKWLVRIEDIDPPREPKGAADSILFTLDSLGLHWDDSVFYQSQRNQAYLTQLNDWLATKQAYACSCTRRRLKSLSGQYDQHCLTANLPISGNAVRFLNHSPIQQFNDGFLGKQIAKNTKFSEDFLIHRRDGLFAYQLAVVLDDIEQGVTHVVRGQDILETTFWQIVLFHQLHKTPPTYCHIPLVMAEDGRKLSKQNHAPAVSLAEKSQLLVNALRFLKQPILDEYQQVPPDKLLTLATQNWQPLNFI
ncbi:tRNA glutamyl-Q(34) synthetase GluQRS [Saccharobesus litoralis]|uniref:tRNA glutamyl-Q(34) synthetase GluQRS n=1 Tax=Saccharobesus litoralis TaxID=2172099 RepID=A0A2S0VS92_9ALTE|nr:tRNA glutamyl-Q(34) synthetase GluQRS [Saccharobesus litoralis]AWB67042.1 tRNA glutamyl-Q(34) synthetase GluQRS [Saccharobesus litoralis]